MKHNRPVLGALMWVLIGAIAAALVFLAHFSWAHDESEKRENDISRNESS